MRSRLMILSAMTFAGLMQAGAPAVAATGAEVYQRQCAACHGTTGAGDGSQAGQNGVAKPRPLADSVTERMTVEKAMLSGVGNVPGHGVAPLLLPDELRQLIDYTYRLAKP
jgi:mono/diheme cytochrome c family protein